MPFPAKSSYPHSPVVSPGAQVCRLKPGLLSVADHVVPDDICLTTHKERLQQALAPHKDVDALTAFLIAEAKRLDEIKLVCETHSAKRVK